MHPHPVAAEFAAAVARRDPRRLAVMVTQTARLRALLPAAVIVAHGRGDVAGSFLGWSPTSTPSRCSSRRARRSRTGC